MPQVFVFRTSTSWEVPNDLPFNYVDILIVGGGGGSGGGINGNPIGMPGGGGAGGVILHRNVAIVPGQTVEIVVGAGGAGGYAGTATTPQNGEGSSYGELAIAGGGGGQYQIGTGDSNLRPIDGGSPGGSGGGGAGSPIATPGDISKRRGGTFSAGFSGGSAVYVSTEHRAGSGGGGATEVGESITEFAQHGGKGGDGLSFASLGWLDQDMADALHPAAAPVDLNETGDWDLSTTYAKGRIVTYLTTFKFVSIQDGNQNRHPTNTSWWMPYIHGVGGGGGGASNAGGEPADYPFGGLYGGGQGSDSVSIGVPRPLAPVANTGGGCGGFRANTATDVDAPGGNNGATGIVIVRESAFVDCGEVGIDQIVYDLARRAGIPTSRIDVSGIAPDSDFGMIWGMGAGRPASARQLIEILQNHSFFDMTEQGGIITASRRDRDTVGLIGGDDLRAHAYGETPPTLCERERTEDYEIPREVRIQYTQALAEYEPGAEGYSRRVTDAEGVVDIDLSAIAMDPDEAAVIAEASMLETIVAREQLTFHLVATPENKALKAGDITTLDVKGLQNVIRIIEIAYAFPGILKIQALRHDPTVYSSDAVGVGRRLIGSIIFNAGATTFELLDAPLVREFDDVPGYFGALGGNPTIPGVVEGWPGGDLQRQEPTGWEDIAQILRPGSVFGVAANALPDAPHTIVTDDELLVTLEHSAFLETVTLQQMLLGANLAALEVQGSEAGWELIRFTTATYSESDGQWLITGIARGVNGTEWATGLHAIGDRFVLLTGVAQVLTDIDLELNQSWQHNAATLGQGAAAAAEVAFTWTGVDRIPYAPAHLAAERDSNDDLLLSWFRRDRVGRELQSGQTLPLSEDSESYEVDIYNGAGDTVFRTLSVTSPEATYTAAQQTTDFGSLPATLIWDVRQMGALGRGYAATTTSEDL